ncbi:DUF1553 domain-containing protein [Rhodopirellula europaea]|uniref:DUF1553 domain-containing protein n=1 Tax=Rhodopirellula europaea TaxID=1263866 RepID=UPI003D2802B1|tara:strand:- start:10663 stop:14451 length:3789 start_codon:yes stop_codon:yes gene_type:complete
MFSFEITTRACDHAWSRNNVRRCCINVASFAALIAAQLLSVSAFAQQTSLSETVAALDFTKLESTPTSQLDIRAHGSIKWNVPGPVPPEYAEAQPGNLSAQFHGKGERLVIDDPGSGSQWDFENGDALSIQAIVKIDEIGEGQNVYIIGKGRTHEKKYASNNQNWAMRLRQLNGSSRISLLFATPEVSGNTPWHRWTSSEGIESTATWNHIAVTYRFGEPKSVRAWLNGKPVAGKWDMGGPTKQNPVVDDAPVWIGSSMGGQHSSSFRGWIDQLTVSRKPLRDEDLKGCWNPPPPPRPKPPEMLLSPGKVTWWWKDDIPTHTKWPVVKADEAELLSIEAPMLLSRLPQKYDSHGIRDSYSKAVYLRVGTELSIPAGDHRFLVRTRGLSRLWMNDEEIAAIGPQNGRTDGHNPVEPLPERPGAGLRRLAYGVQETIAEHSVKENGNKRLILETIVGGTRYRAEPDETMVAVQLNGTGPFWLLSSDFANEKTRQPITDAVIDKQLAKVESILDAHDIDTRRRRAAAHNDYWDERHARANEWIASLAAVEAPTAPKNSKQAAHFIDRFLTAKIEAYRNNAKSIDANTETQALSLQAQSILRERCFRCHDEDSEGGLQLSSAEAIRAGGDSGETLLVSGDPHAGELMRRIRSTDESERMPPSEALPDEEIAVLSRWISAGATWSNETNTVEIADAELVDDESFVRRVYLDSIGVPPTESQYLAFVTDTAENKRQRLIKVLMQRDEVADHWVSFWQDLLAENPNLLKPSLNNTGPFRFFLHDSLIDNKPIDRMATELLMLHGSRYEGGSAGFGMAADNDAPEATRCIVAASAFMGMNLQCARCHDSPYHSTTQEDLYSLAAMLARKELKVPASSSVPAAFFEDHPGRASLIQVTLPPGEAVEPNWPFSDLVDTSRLDRWMREPSDAREKLAVAVTTPENPRFAKVIVNRVWQRLIGTGFVEPLGDWEKATPSHPELLEWLSRNFVASGYDFRELVRTIMQTEVYQCEAVGQNDPVNPANRFFAAPDRRRMSSEQIIDSMVVSSGRPLDVEPLTFDPEARRPPQTMIHLEAPERAWEFTTLSNERDRPSLAFPRAGVIVDVMKTFGWTGSRQSAIDRRDEAPNVLQPGAVGNSVFASWTVAASEDSELADLAVQSDSPDSLTESLFVRFLSRQPTKDERELFANVLSDGFDDRIVPMAHRQRAEPLPELEHVSWSNHLADRANSIKLELEQRAVHGDAPDSRLRSTWRQNYEDVIWSLLNSPEFIWIP